MYKKLFAGVFFIVMFFVFFKTQKYFLDNSIKIVTCDDKEKTIESAFPYKDYMKEIYGLSNRFISPNEKIKNNTAIIKASDGFLEEVNSANLEVVDLAEVKISELNLVCHDNDTEFMFVYYPSKTNSNTETERYGIETNYEAVRKNFIAYLDENNIDYFDVRKKLEKDGYTVEDIFYKTDHHWKTSAGFYAAKEIANQLNARYQLSLETVALDSNKFTYTTYDNLWFGETGRSLSKTWVGVLDDFTLIEPNYETSITLKYADGSEKTGDFSVMIDSSGYNGNVDYYTYTAHYSYAKGMESAMTYHNNLIANENKVLIVKDSFSVVVIPFFILEAKDVSVWDMRTETTKDGLYQYIEDNDFDVVLLAYTDFWRSDMWNFN